MLAVLGLAQYAIIKLSLSILLLSYYIIIIIIIIINKLLLSI